MSTIGATKKREADTKAAAETLYRIHREPGALRIEEVQAVPCAGAPVVLIAHDIFDIAMSKLHSLFWRQEVKRG